MFQRQRYNTGLADALEALRLVTIEARHLHRQREDLRSRVQASAQRERDLEHELDRSEARLAEYQALGPINDVCKWRDEMVQAQSAALMLARVLALPATGDLCQILERCAERVRGQVEAHNAKAKIRREPDEARKSFQDGYRAAAEHSAELRPGSVTSDVRELQATVSDLDERVNFLAEKGEEWHRANVLRRLQRIERRVADLEKPGADERRRHDQQARLLNELAHEERALRLRNDKANRLLPPPADQSGG